ncbi:TDP-N-acetylfucosamine:lipid II N-acetylfucosaminyltransferase [Chitinophaga vietnamensis]|uniref:TDP-N-acetylfucosamine:lipid II N-acetylfucosaminyltransferase n=1 Tax=Chitinophaga vietnamensis TaxID=2593957 RepID=UPI001178BD97|nr:TDP-N-acetylfucosamine:lipid II N-acetylfucosaminyltransferase [Chitinophaga vietnamensis]
MNYHLMVDDKFINDFITDAENAAPGKNVYLIDNRAHKSRFVKSELVTFVPFHTPAFKAILQKIDANDKVFVHWASEQAVQAVLSLPEDVTTGMFFWGGDVVEIPYSRFKKSVYGPQSLRYFEQHEELPSVRWNPARPKRLLTTFAQRYLGYKAPEKAILRSRERFYKRLNFFLNWSYIDYQWLLKHYDTKAAYKYFYYNFNPKPGAEEQAIMAKREARPYTTILLGNSDTVTNNHLEALEALSVYKDEPIKLMIPLSYGNVAYGDLVEKEAKRIFGEDKVMALRGYMERSEYYQLLGQVDVAVMYHYRTQAAGNTLALLYRGKKVYVHSNSTTFEFLKTNNITIFDSKDIAQTSFRDFITPLSEDAIRHNITVMDTLFDPEKKMKVLAEILSER